MAVSKIDTTELTKLTESNVSEVRFAAETTLMLLDGQSIDDVNHQIKTRNITLSSIDDACLLVKILLEISSDNNLNKNQTEIIDSLIAVALGWIRPNLKNQPSLRVEVTDRILSHRIENFPWEKIRPKSTGLALLYNFSPFQDTGATVASKRIRSFGESVDVIACSFLHKKKADPTIELIAEPYVNRRYFLPMTPSWASWEPFKAFAVKAAALAERFMETNNGYDFIYTRAMWAPSLYAGYTFKTQNPQVKWVAEFSDPLSLDVEGLHRGGAVPEDEYSLPLIDAIEKIYGRIPEDKKTIFALSEYAVYAFADEIIFTNSNQKQIMLDKIHHSKLRERAEKKSTVSNHPTLPNTYYNLANTEYEINPANLNLAYFGEFYSSRGITEVTSAIRSLPQYLSEKVHLHVFTNYIPASQGNRRPRQFSQAQYDALVQRAHNGVGANGIEGQVHMNASLPYLKFLATTNKFDYLIVNDARSGDHHDVNPYLPSKWSDYAGSAARSWGFIEEGSILANKPVDIKTPVGDAWKARQDLWDMIIDKFPELSGEN